MSTHEPVSIRATEPVREIPVWAVLERRLFGMLDEAWRVFEQTYCDPDGSLRYGGPMHDRDGADDFYEPFFNWPTLYRLGGSAELLEASKRHWEGVTAQLTAYGFLRDEYELGYDWFHQGESLVFFYALCAADPDDRRFRERARRFADLYLADSPTGNYDSPRRMITAPHTGSGGPRGGLGEAWQEYSPDQAGMRIYGLPLQDIEGIRTWDALREPGNARRMGQAMQSRMGRGDVAINLASVALMANAWLFDHDPARSAWIAEYLGAWRDRADGNAAQDARGVVPDNVGPSGTVGELHDGAWFGGHYGWSWPHGLHSVETAVMVACTSELLVTGDTRGLELARAPLRAVLSHAVRSAEVRRMGSLGPGWAERLGVSDEDELLLVPYRRNVSGWFDYHPLPLTFPMWLWWLTCSVGDRALLERLEEDGGYSWTRVAWMHDKEEQGHEAPWLAYLSGRLPTYPVDALTLALGQVARRLALIRENPRPPQGDDIHWWQRLNPVVVEVLLQLTTGSPPALYNGGLQHARVLYGDAAEGRPGLPPDVAALVSHIGADSVSLSLVNLEPTHQREVVVQAGAFGEDRIDEVEYTCGDDSYPGSTHSYDIPPSRSRTARVAVGASRLTIAMPPLSRISLTLTLSRRVARAAHSSFAHHTEGAS